MYSNVATKRYKGGLKPFLGVLDADRQLFSAELDLSTVQLGQLVTLVQLYKALGGGWGAGSKPPDMAQSVPAPKNAGKP